jgi:hypothetical protein
MTTKSYLYDGDYIAIEKNTISKLLCNQYEFM